MDNTPSIVRMVGGLSKMTGSRTRLGVVLIGLLLSCSAVEAADLLSHQVRACVLAAQSSLPLRPLPEVRQTLWDKFEDAKAGMNDPRVQASVRPAFIWAMESRWACSTAIGYLNGGHLDPESVAKCDCFHQRYLAFR